MQKKKTMESVPAFSFLSGSRCSILWMKKEVYAMKILIVEDEKLLADSLKTLLESKGFDVETVYDGISGA